MNCLQSFMKHHTFVDVRGGKIVNKAVITKNIKQPQKYTNPKCVSCILGKIQYHNINKSKPHLRENVLSIGKLQRGDLIFVDRCRLPNTRGKKSEQEMYNSGTILLILLQVFPRYFTNHLYTLVTLCVVSTHLTVLLASMTLLSKNTMTVMVCFKAWTG